MDYLHVALIAVIVVLVCLPPKHDPAIRWKERNEAAKPTTPPPPKPER